jgi:hypothetical protein
MTPERIAEIIADFFLANGKWQDDEDGWISLSDANYAFRPIDLARRLSESEQIDEPRSISPQGGQDT